MGEYFTVVKEIGRGVEGGRRGMREGFEWSTVDEETRRVWRYTIKWEEKERDGEKKIPLTRSPPKRMT